MAGLQSWVSEHKLTSIGAVWASSIGGSMAYTRATSPLKTSLRLIHARMHAQALTLAVLSGAAAYRYFENRGSRVIRVNALLPGEAGAAEDLYFDYINSGW